MRLLATSAVLFALAACKGDSKSKPAANDHANPVVASDAAARAAPEPVSPGAPAVAPFIKPTITSTATATGWDLEIRVNATRGVDIPGGQVPYTAELYTISAQPKEAAVSESDIFGTGLALDLDGDGSTTGTVPVACNPDGTATVGSATLTPMGDAQLEVMSYSGASRPQRIGERGAYAVLYAPCRSDFVTVGVSPADQPIEVQTFSGPVLQLMLMERVDGPSAAPPSSITELVLDGKPIDTPPHTIHVYEPTFEQPGGWAPVQALVLPLGTSLREHSMSLRVATSARDGIERLVIARIDLGGEPPARRRSVHTTLQLRE